MTLMFSRHTRHRVARLLLGLFLAGQAVLAFAACEMSERSAARAVTSATSGEVACHETDQGMDVSMCAMHCVAGSQTLDKPAFNLQGLAAAPLLMLHSKVQWAAPAAAEIPLPVAGPPPRILFRTLLI